VTNINRVVISGNLVRDPDEPRQTPGGTLMAKFRLASTGRTKQDGTWKDKPNYFDIIVFGNQATSIHTHLTKGSPVTVDGRLDWREWRAQDGGKHQAVEIVADSVQFLGGGSQPEGMAAPVSKRAK